MMVRPIRMQVTFPELQLETTLPSIDMNLQAAHADIGLKPVGPLMEERAQRAQSAGLAAIAQMAQEGDRLAQVESFPDAIIDIASEKWPKERELNVDVAPKHRPTVKLEAGYVSVGVEPGQMRVQAVQIFLGGRWIDVRA